MREYKTVRVGQWCRALTIIESLKDDREAYPVGFEWEVKEVDGLGEPRMPCGIVISRVEDFEVIDKPTKTRAELAAEAFAAACAGFDITRLPMVRSRHDKDAIAVNVAVMKSMYKAGFSFLEIARATNRTKVRVYRLLHLHASELFTQNTPLEDGI